MQSPFFRISALAIGLAFISTIFAADTAVTDPNYQALRGAGVGGAYRVTNFKLVRDVGTFVFQSGTFAFGAPVLGKRVFAVFIGDATFHLTPANPIEAAHLKVIAGAQEFDETFHSAVFCFTDGTAEEIIAKAETADEAATKATGAFRDFRSLVRDHSESPRGRIEALLSGEDAVNVDAELLRELYTPGRESFAAYIHGQKDSDVRFIVNPAGAVPQLPSPEEVALIDADSDADREGILYLSHYRSEWEKNTANSMENHRWVQPVSYRIDTTIGGNDHLSATTVVRMKVLTEGTRVVRFGLLPTLRVESVKMAATPIPFIQESRKQDGSFYAILPEPARAGTEIELTIVYAGDKVIRNDGGGSFSVSARESWYPSLNIFTDQAAYDLTFHVPKRFTLVSTGRMEKSTVDKDTATTHWISEVPLTVAGFNYGEFRKLAKKDEATGYDVEVYTTPQAPDYLRQSGLSIDTGAMAKNAMADTQNALRVFDLWFGKIRQGRVAITQQPQFNFGQSWPTLVYLPVSAFLDETQRFSLLGSSAFKFANFIDEVTPHEVAHQWWGHQVSWATYHDQWLSEGFADFSAGLTLTAMGKSAAADKYWERQRTELTDKNEYGARAGDAGPLWLGERLVWKKNEGAYTRQTYAKGGFILQMLMSMMWDSQTKDQAFTELMHEFTALGGTQSTETFAALVAKHMKPTMDLGGNKTMNWFFQEWVYGTEMPRYSLEYSITPGADGKFKITLHLTQSEVSEQFRMLIPVYVETPAKQLIRAATVPIGGSSTRTFDLTLPFKPTRVAVNALHDVLSVETVNKQVQ